MAATIVPRKLEGESDPLNLPDAFRAKHGRPLRILLIGNIANYAYVTAKMMRRAGVECVVADPDFYHIMASPEWIETSFDGDWRDDFLPKWSGTSLGNYRRPDWFAQGPADIVFRYLELYGRLGLQNALKLRKRMEFARRVATQDISEFDRQLLEAKRRARAILSSGKRRLGRVRGLNGLRSLIARSFVPPSLSAEENSTSANLAGELTDYFRRSGYLGQIPTYEAALRGFDIVQGFTLSAIFAALAKHPRFCAIELGTLRGLPFEDSDLGRLTAWLYSSAPQVMITNIDCVEAAIKLGIPADRRQTILHAYDLDAAIQYASSYTSPRTPLGATNTPYFFAPARHHWKTGNLSWLKGNDVIIRAAGSLARQGNDFRLVFVEWGEEIALSKELIAAEGLADRVTWVKPQPRLNLWPLYMGACAVVDQFKAAAFGGVGLDAMALGRRLISRYDPRAGSLYFSTPPPMFNCSTEGEVSTAMAQCLADPSDQEARGAQLQTWMVQEHSMERQLRDHFAVYEKLLSAAPLV